MTWQPTFKYTDVTQLKSERAYDGFFKLNQVQIDHPRFDGGRSGPVNREVMIRGHAVAVVCYDVALHRFVLIEQFRIGPWYSGANPWLLEVVAGMTEEGETDRAVAVREVAEETGIAITEADLTFITQYYPSPGGTDEQVTLFAATVDSTTARQYAGVETEHEDIKIQVVDANWAFDACRDAIIDNSATIMGIQWVQLYGDSLKRLTA